MRYIVESEYLMTKVLILRDIIFFSPDDSASLSADKASQTAALESSPLLSFSHTIFPKSSMVHRIFGRFL